MRPPWPVPGMSPPPTGSMQSLGPPMMPPMAPPLGSGPLMGPGPPTAMNMRPGTMPLGPGTMPPGSMGGPPMGTMPPGSMMGRPPMSGVGLPAPMTGSMPPTGVWNGQPMSDQAPVDGFGGPMQGTLKYPEVEVRQAPFDRRPENNPIGDHQKDLRGFKVDEEGNRFSTGTDKLSLYGALDDLHYKEVQDQRDKLRRRRRINAIPALLALFVPWLVFLGTYYVASFFLHYAAPFFTFLILLGVLVAAFVYWRKSYTSFQRNPSSQNYYPAYVSAASLLAALIGWVFGDFNFWTFMQPCYNVDFLASYNNVNPSTQTLKSGMVIPTRGQRYQDAGEVYFDHDTVLDFNKSMSFKNGDLYCVTPIVNKNCKKNCGYDFWAVGTNCCAEDMADFRCGDYKNGAAKSGLRLTHDHQRPSFRMAVMEAEGVHKIISTHPLFFTWVQNPKKELSHMKKLGFKTFIILMIVMFFVSGIAAYFGLKWAREMFWED